MDRHRFASLALVALALGVCTAACARDRWTGYSSTETFTIPTDGALHVWRVSVDATRRAEVFAQVPFKCQQFGVAEQDPQRFPLPASALTELPRYRTVLAWCPEGMSAEGTVRATIEGDCPLVGACREPPDEHVAIGRVEGPFEPLAPQLPDGVE